MKQQERSKRKDPGKKAISGSEVNKMNHGTVTDEMRKHGSLYGKVQVQIDRNTVAFIDPGKDENSVMERYVNRVFDFTG